MPAAVTRRGLRTGLVVAGAAALLATGLGAGAFAAGRSSSTPPSVALSFPTPSVSPSGGRPTLAAPPAVPAPTTDQGPRDRADLVRRLITPAGYRVSTAADEFRDRTAALPEVAHLVDFSAYQEYEGDDGGTFAIAVSHFRTTCDPTQGAVLERHSMDGTGATDVRQVGPAEAVGFIEDGGSLALLVTPEAMVFVLLDADGDGDPDPGAAILFAELQADALGAPTGAQT